MSSTSTGRPPTEEVQGYNITFSPLINNQQHYSHCQIATHAIGALRQFENANTVVQQPANAWLANTVGSHIQSTKPLPPPVASKQVTHSIEGMDTLCHFLFDICGVTAGWKMEDVLEGKIKVIKAMVGPEDHVICALSGGVDSTVTSTVVHKAIGDRLHCVFIDDGLLRFAHWKRL